MLDNLMGDLITRQIKITAESQLSTQTYYQMDKRVPPEIWERIFNRLYPSQLSRMSMVNKNFNKVVSSLSLWARMFSLAFGAEMRLRTLCGIPESKSYMLYMCARSRYICEKCFRVAKFYDRYDDFQITMMSALAPMPTLSKGNIKYIGEEINQSWTIWVCKSCSSRLLGSTLEQVDDEETRSRILCVMNMSDLSALYKELLDSNDGDILVKLKDVKELKITSFLIKKRSPVFKTMLESSMNEAALGMVDLSRQYSLEAFREFMAYVYYNKLYTGSYVPLLYEILCITDYYEIDSYRSYIEDQIIKLITNVPICLTIASEALKHGTSTS
ncbi:hypothetical protein EC991_001557, partial [Linnemannia zychae]